MQSLPQFFGQSFSSSSFVNQNGEVVSNSLYTDSLGNQIVNGQNVPQQQEVSQAAQPQAPQPSAPQPKPVAQTQSTVPKKVNSGQYIPDDRGKYKGN